MCRKSLIIDSFFGGGGGVSDMFTTTFLTRNLIKPFMSHTHHHEVEDLAKCRLPPSPRPSSLMAQGHMDTDATISFKTKPPPPSSTRWSSTHRHISNHHHHNHLCFFSSFSLLCNNLESYLDWMFTESSNVGFGGSRNSIAGYAFSKFACYLGLR